MREKRAPGTVKFSVSMPAADYRAIEASRRRAGKSRSQFLREAVLGASGRDLGSGALGAVREERAVYATVDAAVMTDAAELRRRAVAAAGTFASGLGDLAAGHDKYLAEPGSDRDERPSGPSGEGEGRA